MITTQQPLQLTNSGELSLFFIGVGSAFSKQFFQTNLLIVKGNDHLLIDCGSTCSYAFYSYHSDITKVKNFLITHSHADHIGGLEEVAFIGRYTTGQKPAMIITDEYKKILWEQSLRGGMSYSEHESKCGLEFDDYFSQIKPVLLSGTPRPVYEANINTINLKLFRTKHLVSQSGSWNDSFFSLGALIDEQILFTGDMRFDPEIIDWMEQTYPDITCIFHDCQLSPGGVHASYQELCTLPAQIKKRMYLCHYGDDMTGIHPEEDGFAGFARQGVYYTFGAQHLF